MKTLRNLLIGASILGLVSCGPITHTSKTTTSKTTNKSNLTKAQEMELTLVLLDYLTGKSTNKTLVEGAKIVSNVGHTYVNSQSKLDYADRVSNKTNITINNNPPIYNQPKVSNTNRAGTPIGLFLYTSWEDKNNDRVMNGNEIIDLNLPVYNAKDANVLCIGFYPGNNNLCDGSILFKILRMEPEFKLITSLSDKYENGVKLFYYDLNTLRIGGKYRFSLYTKKGTFFKEVEIRK